MAMTFKIKLVNEQSGKRRDYHLPVSDFTSNAIQDAINQHLKGNSELAGYDRISFQWTFADKPPTIIHLTNPASNGQDTHPYYTTDKAGAMASYDFCGLYFAADREKENRQRAEEMRKSELDQNEKLEPVGPPNFDLPTPKLPENFHKGDFLDSQADWQTRWNNAMQHSRDVRARDWQLKHRHKATVEFAVGNIAKEMSESNNPVSDIVAIAHILRIGFDTGFKLLSFLPEEIAATADRFQMNLEIVSLSIERLITIISGMFEIISKSWMIASKLDWNKALNMASKWLDNQEKALQYGIETGMLDKDYNPTGAEKWQIPQTAPNSPEEFKKWLAISGLTHCPFVGSTVEDVMRFDILRQYQQRTGVGIPDDYAWMKYILGNQIGVTVPIQDALDIAGQIPDWFLQHTSELSRIGKQIHEESHKELKQLKH